MLPRIVRIIFLSNLLMSIAISQMSAVGQSFEMTETAKEYLEEVFLILETESLFKDETDWNIVRAAIIRQAAGSSETHDTYDAIVSGLQMIDSHSLLLDRDYTRIWPSTYIETEAPLLPTVARGERLQGEVAYLLVPRHSPKSENEAEEYSTALQSLMKSIDGERNCGWIVDLRFNSGGNMWPMIEALSSLFGTKNSGILGAWIASDREKPTWWGFRNGRGFSGDEYLPDYIVSNYVVRQPSAPVAILIGGWTKSSGEFLAVAFTGRQKTALFGEDSAGFLTANSSFVLSDGATLALATARATDRLGRPTGERLQPDIRIASQPIGTDIANDKTIASAKEWVMRTSECEQH